jgi:hypothetical protein
MGALFCLPCLAARAGRKPNEPAGVKNFDDDKFEKVNDFSDAFYLRRKGSSGAVPTP